MSDGYRQEVFNVLLAQLLRERGVISAPESVVQIAPEKHRRMPDVIVNFSGLRTAIEGEVDDAPDAEKKAIGSARQRVEDSIAHIGIAVVYPKELRGEDFDELKIKLARSSLKMAIVTESTERGFISGNVDQLEIALRHAFEELVQEDVVTKAVAVIDAGIEQFARILTGKKGVVERVADSLGIKELPQKARQSEDEIE